MTKQEFQKELLLYTEKRLAASEHSDRERNVQLAYQLGIAIGLLWDLTDADSYNYKRILYTLHPELKNKK
jgi:hypothetical protein